MKLFTNPASPFCRKVEVLLHEAGMSELVTTQVVAGHPTDPGTLPITVNPIGKIPTLVTKKGAPLYDSRVITRYLDAHGDVGFYAEDEIWNILTLEATADGISDAAVAMVYESRSRPEDMQYPPFVEGQWAKITRALDHIETRWMDHLNGTLTMAHIAVACALGYLDFRHQGRDWRDNRLKLTVWYAAFAERPSMKATDPQV